MDWTTIQNTVYGGTVIGLAVWLGKTWILPLLTRTFDNSVANATASGSLLATIIAERDQWKARAIELDRDLQDLREKVAKMESGMGVLQYQLKEARQEIVSLTGKPFPPEDTQ